MLVEYAATEKGPLDDSSDADPNYKSIRGNGIITFLLHVAHCMIFNQTNHVKTILTSTNFEEARSRFQYETGKSKVEQKKNIGLQCLHTIPRRVTFLHYDQINFNIHNNVFRNLYVDPTSETWFPNKYMKLRSRKK